MLSTPGNFIKENYNLPNGMSIIIDYGIIDDDFKNPYIFGLERFMGSSRRSRLFNEKKLITEVIEDNPDFFTLDQEEVLAEKHIRKGDDFEKTIHFDDGKIAKIEYWMTPKTRDKNFGLFDAKYRKIILLDESGKIISEKMELNPNRESKGHINSVNDYDDDFLD